jgi:hypothetical protein
VNRFPTTDVHILTQNVALVGAYNFKIKVTDPLTGLFNDADVFTCTILAPNYATNLVFVSASLIADFNYLISDPQVLLNAPSFTVTPSDADVQYSYALVGTTPSFVTLVPQGAGNPQV